MKLGDLKRIFGTAIKAKRSELGFSQEELAHRAGLHRTYVSDVERGARNVSLESIEKLAGALDLSVSGLFARVGSAEAALGPEEILLVEDRAEDVEQISPARQCQCRSPDRGLRPPQARQARPGRPPYVRSQGRGTPEYFE